MHQFDSVISTQFLMFQCCLEDPMVKVDFVLEWCPNRFHNMYCLEVYFSPLIDFYLMLENCTNLCETKPRKMKTVN